MACTHLANMVGHCLCSAGAACRPAAWLLVPEMDAIGRRRQPPPRLLCWELACVQHVDVNAATKTWIYFYALARVHCSNCCSHFKNSNTAGKAVWKILIIRLVSRPPTASLSATCLTEFITTRPLFMRPPIEEAPSPLLLLFVRWTRLISHAARSPNWALIIPCTCTLTISQCNDYGKL